MGKRCYTAYSRLAETAESNALDEHENVLENTSTLADYLSVSDRTIRRALAVLQSKGLIYHKGPTKNGYWEVNI